MKKIDSLTPIIELLDEFFEKLKFFWFTIRFVYSIIVRKSYPIRLN